MFLPPTSNANYGDMLELLANYGGDLFAIYKHIKSTLYTLNLHNFICQLYLNKARKIILKYGVYLKYQEMFLRIFLCPMSLNLFFFFFFLMDAPMSHGSSWSEIESEPQFAAMLDPLTHCTGD